MSAENNKILVRRMFEEDLNTDNRAKGAEFFSPDFFDHTNPPGMQRGIEGHNAIVTLFRAAFPDGVWTVEDIFASDDRVCARVVFNATHKGDFFGIPATGKTVSFSGVHVLRVVDNKIIEHWGNNDDLGLMRQLGVVPEMA
jgi:steroid delta-isomerase-like uncharacterized protein